MNTFRASNHDLLTIPNARIPARNLIGRALRPIYDRFISIPELRSLVKFSQARTAQISLGMQNGLDGSFLALPGAPSSPYGFDRCTVVADQQGFCLASKGTGLRNAQTSYLEAAGFGEGYKPIDINPDAYDYGIHPLIGGALFDQAKDECQGAMTLLSLASKIGIGQKQLGGLLVPLCARDVRFFPVVGPDGELKRVYKGKNKVEKIYPSNDDIVEGTQSVFSHLSKTTRVSLKLISPSIF